MSQERNIRIIVNSSQDLDIENPESIGIKLSRKVDDFNDLSRKIIELFGI